MRDHEEYNTVPVGEEIAVEVTFKNPLQVKLKLSSIRLICEFQPTPANPSNTAGSSSVDSTASNTDVVGDGVDGSSSESAPGVQAAPTSGQVCTTRQCGNPHMHFKYSRQLATVVGTLLCVVLRC